MDRGVNVEAAAGVAGRAAALWALASLLLVATSLEGFGQSIGKVVGVEAGYGYIASGGGLNPQSPSGAIAGLRYGYLILDRPSMTALLSLALGYDLFPQGAGGKALNAIVYGLEYEHTLFRQNPVALSFEYGLLFDLVFEGGRQGYAYGNYTRLGLGPDVRLGEKDDLVLLADYNIVDLPFFELSSAQFGYPSVALRYQRRL
jgi:hypothetical protein